MIISLLAGAAGYVLGARAGRERYDQIMELARRVRGIDSGREDPSGQQQIPAMITDSDPGPSATGRGSRGARVGARPSGNPPLGGHTG